MQVVCNEDLRDVLAFILQQLGQYFDSTGEGMCERQMRRGRTFFRINSTVVWNGST